MIDRSHVLPVTRQAKILGISRSSIYYQPCGVSAGDLVIMRRIDALHLEHPFAGSRMLRDLLRGEGFVIGREAGSHDDEAHGRGGDVPAPEHVQAGTRPPDLPVSVA